MCDGQPLVYSQFVCCALLRDIWVSLEGKMAASLGSKLACFRRGQVEEKKKRASDQRAGSF